MSKLKASPRRQSAISISIGHVLLAYVLPILAGVLLQSVAGGRLTLPGGNNAPFLAGIGLGGWLLGLQWFGIRGMGLRGKRPLFASIGFATLGWVILFAVRFYFLSWNQSEPTGAFRLFFYLLVFEAFAMQLWAFGLLFHVFTRWRGGLPAVFGSGITFGIVAFWLFREAAFSSDLSALVYFIVWGCLFGMIRLRTGSILGSVLIQALSSFTVWDVFAVFRPLPVNDVANLPWLYFAASIGYALVIWRLWPKQADDYRI